MAILGEIGGALLGGFAFCILHFALAVRILQLPVRKENDKNLEGGSGRLVQIWGSDGLCCQQNPKNSGHKLASHLDPAKKLELG